MKSLNYSTKILSKLKVKKKMAWKKSNLTNNGANQKIPKTLSTKVIEKKTLIGIHRQQRVNTRKKCSTPQNKQKFQKGISLQSCNQNMFK